MLDFFPRKNLLFKILLILKKKIKIKNKLLLLFQHLKFHLFPPLSLKLITLKILSESQLKTAPTPN